MRSFLFFIVSVIALTSFSYSDINKLPPILEPSDSQRKEYDLPPRFFKKSLLVQDILIATSDKVSDLAVNESAYLFDQMMKDIDPDVAAA